MNRNILNIYRGLLVSDRRYGVKNGVIYFWYKKDKITFGYRSRYNITNYRKYFIQKVDNVQILS